MHVQEEIMHRTQLDNAARANAAQPDVELEAAHGSSEVPTPKLLVVQSTDSVRSVDQTPLDRPDAAQTNQVFAWGVGAGLVILILLLAVIMFNAGINVEVLP
jgi:hypothetical protein